MTDKKILGGRSINRIRRNQEGKNFFGEVDKQLEERIRKVWEDLFKNISSQENLNECISNFEGSTKIIKDTYRASLINILNNNNIQENEIDSKMKTLDSDISAVLGYLDYITNKPTSIDRRINKDLQELTQEYQNIKKPPTKISGNTSAKAETRKNIQNFARDALYFVLGKDTPEGPENEIIK
ncbi:MAG: hypothetical protein ORN26_00675 [Candidatus Pacebacteria bacterium]|nr:hypothetical protein [Candidatus Paceibacterota bacterium]